MTIQGISTNSDATAKDIVKLMQQIKLTKTKVVFFENMTNNKLINQIAHDAKIKIGGKLYSDALSNDSIANNYINLIKANTNALIKAWI